MKKLLICVWFVLLALSSSAQVSINTNLTTGTMTTGVANLYRTAYLHFQLVNCGDNIPVIPGQPDAVIQDSFDLRPATPGSAVVGEIIGNDQITCGNIVSTYYEVTAMKDASHPLRDGIPYVICSASATITTCGNGASLGTFNLVTADPMNQPPPVPGFVEIYGNPTNDQTINQPVNGIAGWGGLSTSFTFLNGLILGPVSTAQLSLLTGFADVVLTSDSVPGSSPCTGGGTGALAVYLNSQWSCSTSGAMGGGTLTSLAPTAPITMSPNPITMTGTVGVSNATTGAVGVVELAGDLGGTGTAPTVVNGSHVTNSSITNSGLANPATTVNGQTCTLGSTCTISAGVTSITAASPIVATPSPITGTGVVSCPTCNTGLPLPSPQVGDIIRYNVNSDSAWDAVNYSARQAVVYFSLGTGLIEAYGGPSTPAEANTGGQANVYPTNYTDSPARQLVSTSTASTTTSIGVSWEQGGNYADFPFGSWYRWTARFAANETTNARYWLGMGSVCNGGTGQNSTAILSSAVYATDTPNKSTVGFVYSAGSSTWSNNTHWQAATVTAGSSVGTQTIADTGVVADTNPHTFETVPVIVSGSLTGYNYFIDHVLVANITTTMPSGIYSGSCDPFAETFWTGDNKNTANVVGGTFYYMALSLR